MLVCGDRREIKRNTYNCHHDLVVRRTMEKYHRLNKCASDIFYQWERLRIQPDQFLRCGLGCSLLLSLAPTQAANRQSSYVQINKQTNKNKNKLDSIEWFCNSWLKLCYSKCSTKCVSWHTNLGLERSFDFFLMIIHTGMSTHLAANRYQNLLHPDVSARAGTNTIELTWAFVDTRKLL